MIPFNPLLCRSMPLKITNPISYSYFGLLSMNEENMSVTLIINATNVKYKPV